MLLIIGQNAWSAHQLEKRAEQLPVGVAGEALSARFVYFVDTAATLKSTERTQLDLLLDSMPASLGAADAWWVLPRAGTISPWSSKATDIAHSAGLGNIRRIERGIHYTLGTAAHDLAMRAAVARALYDRMTETVYTTEPQFEHLFATQAPRPLMFVDIAAAGIGALQSANQTMGLALADNEIDHLYAHYKSIGRNPSDAELMMFAQANSEHCRHKVFNSRWLIDGIEEPLSLFDMIRHTTASTPAGVLSAYSDNAAVVAGHRSSRLLLDPESHSYVQVAEDNHLLMKVETHNHPTAISPFAGAATGAGGEIRDEGATGLGATPKAGLCGFSVSHLRIPGGLRDWEVDTGRPERIASARQIMLDGPLGAAAFNNEFGRPNLAGYFRSYEQVDKGNDSFGYHKPIMIAGGMGNVRPQHTNKIDLAAGHSLLVLGGPAMLIGLGGGAASSVASGDSDADLDFASVQRGNPEMQRRAQEVINRCWELGDNNPIQLIHDVGAGGLSNAVPEACDHSGLGGSFELRAIPCDEPGLSPMELWCNESQERYVLVVATDDISEVQAIAERERCPVAYLGDLNDSGQLQLTDKVLDQTAVDMTMSVLLGKMEMPQRVIDCQLPIQSTTDPLPDLALEAAIKNVLGHPTVASKAFLIHIGDRSVGGLTSRDQMVGPWQVPVSDVAVTASGYGDISGEAMAMGERTPVATHNAPASGRLAVAEALTNIAAADFGKTANIRLSANWMAAIDADGQAQALFDTVRAVALELCPALDVAIPVGKDSLSMRTRWETNGETHTVTAPLSLIVTAFAPVSDIGKTLTPQLTADVDSTLYLLDLSAGQDRLGGSILSEVFELGQQAVADLDAPEALASFMSLIQCARQDGLLQAYHDRSDGGLLACVAECQFASRVGVQLDFDELDDAALLARLFCEEPGAIVQVADADVDAWSELIRQSGLDVSCAQVVGRTNQSDCLQINARHTSLNLSRTELEQCWSETSYRMQSLRDNPVTAAQEYEQIRRSGPGLAAATWSGNFVRPPALLATRPQVAILREQGVNSHYEMAAAFMQAGFEPVDVPMSDLIAGRHRLDDFQGLAACGGFSFGDVLGAGGGWAKSILFQDRLRDKFLKFFEHPDRFALGVCNGCQMFSQLSELIPGATLWPRFQENTSGQFEARLSLVAIEDTASWLLRDMQGFRLPIATSHGEGKATFEPSDEAKVISSHLVAARYVDDSGAPANRYPMNPNGSPEGICALTSATGRVTIIMPHPERVARTAMLSWAPADWPEESPWSQLFLNAYRAIS